MWRGGQTAVRDCARIMRGARRRIAAEAAGAILIGNTNVPEFLMGDETERVVRKNNNLSFRVGGQVNGSEAAARSVVRWEE